MVVELEVRRESRVERVEEAVRVARKVDRPNVGVTINGADAGGDNWNTLIQPLGDGTYDVRPLLDLLAELNYDGPIGLQGYGIGGDVAENLRRSMAA